jgi:hypothetical protein
MKYLFNFENFGKNMALFDQSLNEYLQLKMITLLGSNFWYLSTICINSN